MTQITVVALLHALNERFKIYPMASLATLLAGHQGALWVPPIVSQDVAFIKQQGKPLLQLASLSDSWCDLLASESASSPALQALWQYDDELLANLSLYWSQASKVNSPITDNLFELRREVVDEAYGAKFAARWQTQQQLRLTQILNAAKEHSTILCFVEVEAAYWLRQKLAEQADITLCYPQLDTPI